LEGGGTYDSTVISRLGSHGAWHNPGGAYDTHDGVVMLHSYSENSGYRGDARFVRFTVGCYTQSCALETDGASRVGSIFAAVFGATVTVNDPTAPKVARVFPTGLAAGGLVGGSEPLTFDASDGSGIKRAELLDVTGDPKVVATKDFACDYSYAAPCPAGQGAQIAPQQLDGGTRTLQVRLTDAAGNVGLGDKFSVDVGGPLNGTPANAAAKLTTTFARNKHHSVFVGFGKRASVRGRLVDATNAPIAGATIQVLWRMLRTGSTQYAPLAEVTTDAKGRFRYLPTSGPARAFRFEYRSRRFLAAANASTKVTMRVRAGVRLNVRPRHVPSGGRIRLFGRLLGGPIPLSGKVVDLQAYEAGRWRTFDTVRARKSAKFSTRYRFRRVSRKTIAFRAQVRREDSYPYYLGYSRRVKVRIG
jgi:hypothetical protein